MLLQVPSRCVPTVTRAYHESISISRRTFARGSKRKKGGSLRGSSSTSTSTSSSSNGERHSGSTLLSNVVAYQDAWGLWDVPVPLLNESTLTAGSCYKAAQLFRQGHARIVQTLATPEDKLQGKGKRLPRVAFAGRSNVGKSTLINTITGSKTLMRTSQTPGRTQLINIARVNNLIDIIDMPGYGFGNAPSHEKKRWRDTIRSLFRTGDTHLPNIDPDTNLEAISHAALSHVCILIDARRGCTYRDNEFIRFAADCQVAPVMVLTKCDRASFQEIAMTRGQCEKALHDVVEHPVPVLPTSAMTGYGIIVLQLFLAQLANKL